MKRALKRKETEKERSWRGGPLVRTASRMRSNGICKPLCVYVCVRVRVHLCIHVGVSKCGVPKTVSSMGSLVPSASEFCQLAYEPQRSLYLVC